MDDEQAVVVSAEQAAESQPQGPATPHAEFGLADSLQTIMESERVGGDRSNQEVDLQALPSVHILTNPSGSGASGGAAAASIGSAWEVERSQQKHPLGEMQLSREMSWSHGREGLKLETRRRLKRHLEEERA
ncbi:unnamed protein product [Lampetra fluviatilis]